MIFEINKRYEMSLKDARAVINQMGYMAALAKGQPDISRGRRYVNNNNGDQWEFWMTSGQKVSFSVSLTGEPNSDHFIASVSDGVDYDRPGPLTLKESK